MQAIIGVNMMSKKALMMTSKARFIQSVTPVAQLCWKTYALSLPGALSDSYGEQTGVAESILAATSQHRLAPVRIRRAFSTLPGYGFHEGQHE